MEPIETTGNPETDTLLLVLKELLEEQKELRKTAIDQVAALNQLTTKVNSFQEKLEGQKITVAATDTQSLQEIVKKGIIEIESFPKNCSDVNKN